MVRLTEEQLNSLTISQFDQRAGVKRDFSDTNGSSLKTILTAADDVAELSENLVQGGQFSVFSSLPAIASALSSTTQVTTETLLALIKFVTGENAFASDLKDWTFIEDTLDSVFSRIDEAIAMDDGTVKRTRLEKDFTAVIVRESRPQDAWRDVIDNHRTSFIPMITEKPHALEPLDSLLTSAQEDASVVPTGFEFPHVYGKEIRESLGRISEQIESITGIKEVVDFNDLQSTELVYVDTIEKLDSMIEAIKAEGEMAMDLEHHDTYSYRGFTCLIQISTRSVDYIVDPFPLFHRIGGRLNQVTTDPHIRKTLHGADMDIQWLQRDFGVYIVNMFDTGQAARVLGLAGGYGLANLLETLCKVGTNKRFQTSDWRTRPLSKDMVQYARTDTHYLLYIRDRLENLVLGLGSGTPGLVTAYGRKMLAQVMEKSANISLKTWKDSVCESADQVCLKSSALKVGHLRSNVGGMAILEALLGWRDHKARDLDVSRNYVLTNATCLRLANLQPSTVSQILRAVSQEASSMYPSMRIGSEEADELLTLIQGVQVPSTHTQAEEVVMNSSVPTPSKRASSVVQVGGAFERRLSGSRRSSLVGSPIRSLVDVGSSLGQLWNKPIDTLLPSDKHKSVLAELVKEFSQCPAELRDELQAYKDALKMGSVESVEATAIAPVAFLSEFVSFKSADPHQAAIVTAEKEGAETDIPLTVREQRKRAPETATQSGSKKRKSTNNAGTAAVKALEFIEQELCLKKR
jgi:ribonuclease D